MNAGRANKRRSWRDGPDNIRNPVLIRLPWAVKAKVPKETRMSGEASLNSNGRGQQRAAVSRRTGRLVVRVAEVLWAKLELVQKIGYLS
jgi:hypothetical protein